MNRNKNIVNFKLLKMSRSFVFVLISYILHLTTLTAQVEVHAVLDSNKIRIGEQTRLDLYVRYDASVNKKLNIQWPIIEDTLKKEI